MVIDPALNWGPAEEQPLPDFDILGAPTDGTFAEQVVVPAANLAAKPERLSWEAAAALNLGGLTAWRAAVTCAVAAPSRTVLVTGAGSGVASFAIQIVAALGARVFVTSSTQAKLERARALGAVAGVSYREPDWPEQIVSLAGGELDAAIDSYGGPSWEGALRTLRSGGTLVSFGDTSGPGDDGDDRGGLLAVAQRAGHLDGQPEGVPRDVGARSISHVAARDRQHVRTGRARRRRPAPGCS